MLPIPNPIAFTVFGIDIRWYAITMVLGLILGLAVAIRRAPRFGITEDDTLDLFIWLVPFSIIGARAYYVIFEWGEYSSNPISVFYIRNGGLAVHGAIIAGIIVIYLYSKFKKFSFLKLLDFVAPCMALGQSIGRWGNYFNMEAHGRITDVPWAIPVYDVAHEIKYVHPTFLYESLWDLMTFLLVLYFENKRETKCGQGACLYLFVYSVGRCVIEGMRTDSLYIAGLRTAQLVSVALIIIGSVGFLVLKMYGRPFKLLSPAEAKAFVEEQREKRTLKNAKLKPKKK